jgi:hypothetical protein
MDWQWTRDVPQAGKTVPYRTKASGVLNLHTYYLSVTFSYNGPNVEFSRPATLREQCDNVSHSTLFSAAKLHQLPFFQKMN